MRDHLDGRSVVGFGCGLVSLFVLMNPLAGVFFGAFGVIFAGASVVAVDEAPTTRTRRVAAAALLLAGSALAAVFFCC